jgi:hypothetical protein
MVNIPQGESAHANIKSVLGKLAQAEREMREDIHGSRPGGSHVFEAHSFVIQAIASLSKILSPDVGHDRSSVGTRKSARKAVQQNTHGKCG